MLEGNLAPYSAGLRRAATLIQAADGLVIAAGAGMGVDSGLPDFRGDTGFWKAYPALAAARLSFSAVASPKTFEIDPALAWGFYGHRLDLYRRTIPHQGFVTLQDWGARLDHGAVAFTSNVDGHFQTAGFRPELVEECHGSIHWLQCLAPCSGDIWSAQDLVSDIDEVRCRWRGALPNCPKCGSLLRPNILMFGDSEWLAQRYMEQHKRVTTWLAGCRRPVVIEIGAGTDIPSVRYFTQAVLTKHRGSLIRINPREAGVRRAEDVALPLRACDAIVGIDCLMTGRPLYSR